MLTLSASGLSCVLPDRLKSSETFGKAKAKLFDITLVNDVFEGIDSRTEAVAKTVEGIVNSAPKQWRALQHRVDYCIPPTDDEKKVKTSSKSTPIVKIPREAGRLFYKCIFRVKEIVSKTVVAAPSTAKAYASTKVGEVAKTAKFQNFSKTCASAYESGMGKVRDVKTDWVMPTIDVFSIQYKTTKEAVMPYVTKATESKCYADLMKRYTTLLEKATPFYEKAQKFALDTSKQWPFSVFVNLVSGAKAYVKKNVPLEWLTGQTRTAA